MGTLSLPAVWLQPQPERDRATERRKSVIFQRRSKVSQALQDIFSSCVPDNVTMVSGSKSQQSQTVFSNASLENNSNYRDDKKHTLSQIELY